MKYLGSLAALALIAACLSACGSAPRGTGGANEAGASRGGSVEVFGVIDAGVGHVTNKSGR